jgi:glycosyltransferase involved in cell wall biosynthesis
VYRALATANRFAERGWDVTVVTIVRDAFARYFGTDTGLEQQVDPRIRVVRTPFEWPTLEPDLARWSWWRVHTPRLWTKTRTRRDRAAFPEIGYGPWRATLERTVVEVHRERPVDLVVATANPNVAFAGAWRLGRQGVRYVLDYRDAWQLDVFSGDRVTPAGSRVDKLESRYLAGATEAWFVNDEIRDWHRAAHPTVADRMKTVANGYDRAFAPSPRPARPAGERPLRFGYIGTVTPKVPLAEFVAGWRRAADDGALPASATAVVHGYLGYYGQPRADLAKLLDQAAASGVTYGGPVGKADVARTYAGFDVLLLILGAGRYVTSGKVYEYLASGLPIVSVHDPGNAASRLLADYPLWFPAASLAPDDVAAALGRAAQAARDADPDRYAAAARFGERMSREGQLDPRIDALASLVAEGVHA